MLSATDGRNAKLFSRVQSCTDPIIRSSPVVYVLEMSTDQDWIGLDKD